jgi:hypothetical protein
MKKNISIILALAVLGTGVFGACFPNKKQSEYSCCNPDDNTSPYQTQFRTTQDQAGQQAAYTYCLEECVSDTAKCSFRQPASCGCVSSGSYSKVWKWQANKVQLNNDTCHYYSFNYSAVTPSDGGETQKYINDNMNCGG